MTTPQNKAKQLWWKIEWMLERLGYKFPDKAAGHPSAVIRHEEEHLDYDYAKGGPSPKGRDAYRGTV